MHMRMVENCAKTRSEVKQDSIRLPSRFHPESVELQAGVHTRLVQKCVQLQAGMHTLVVEKGAKTRSKAEGKIKRWSYAGLKSWKGLRKV
jgi:hypothetical protein